VPGPMVRASAFRVPVDLGSSVLPASLVKYERAIADYDRWASLHGLPVVASFEQLSSRAVNALIVARLQQMTLDLEPPAHASFLLAGIINRHPWLRRDTAEAWHAVRTWQRSAPLNCRVGLDGQVYRAMVSLALTWGWRLMACLVVLGYEGLLRPGELAELRRSDIRLPTDSQGLLPEVVVVCIRVPKTRRRAARLQSVVIRARWAVKLITAALCGVPRDVALCTGGSLGLRQRFRALVCGLRLPPETYTPGSLRPGGAIAHHLAHNDLGRLLFHGRWDSVKTVQHYLHEGVAVSVAAQIEPAAARLVLAMSRLLDELTDELVLEVPAALRWQWPAWLCSPLAC